MRISIRKNNETERHDCDAYILVTLKDGEIYTESGADHEIPSSEMAIGICTAAAHLAMVSAA